MSMLMAGGVVDLAAASTPVPRTRISWSDILPEVQESSRGLVNPCVGMDTGTNPSQSTINGYLKDAADDEGLPPQLLKVIAFNETGWRQFDSSGHTVMNGLGDGGIGMMQITGSTQSGFDIQRLCQDTRYNIGAGAQVLREKFQATERGVSGSLDETLIENWLIAARCYNGSGSRADTYLTDVIRLLRAPTEASGDWFEDYTAPQPTTDPRDLYSGFDDDTRLSATIDGTFTYFRHGAVVATARATVHRWAALGDGHDVGGDGLGDVFARTTSGALYYYEGHGDGVFDTRVLTYSTGWSSYTALMTADVDGNGESDVLARSLGALYFYAGRGDGTFDTRVRTYADGFSSYESLTAADVNGDAKADIVARDDGALYYYQGRGDGTFVTRIRTYSSGWSSYDTLLLGDVTGDGKADLMARTGGALYYYRGRGDGTFDTRIRTYSTGWSSYNALVLADVTGDGQADILARDVGALYYYQGRGDGTFDTRIRTYSTGWSSYNTLF